MGSEEGVIFVTNRNGAAYMVGTISDSTNTVASNVAVSNGPSRLATVLERAKPS